MTQLNGYGSYRLFLALRAHFSNSNYDFFKFQGKVNASKETFENRNDRKFFESLSHRYDAKELRDFYIANFLVDRIYITDLLDEEASDVYFEYRKRRENLSYVFETEINKLFSKGVKEPFETISVSYPKLLMWFLRGEVSIDTMVILNDLIGYTSKFDKYLENDILWTNIKNKISKYKPFLRYDSVKIKSILREAIDEQREENQTLSTKAATYRKTD